MSEFTKSEDVTGSVLDKPMMLGRDANEWLDILDYARERGWKPVKPKLKEGQEVWVRAEVWKGGNSLVIRRDPYQAHQRYDPAKDDDPGCSHISVNPDDIRTDEP